ncbi:MAG: mobile mystery protein B [Pirellulales bacterium]|nr:mobile mystery protein B [Pirellulales bacterium]
MSDFAPIPGETPIDVSHLRDRSIRTRAELARREFANIRRPIVRYLSSRPNRRLAPFTFEWMLGLHGEMFGEVWQWAGQTRTENLNLGSVWQQVGPSLLDLASDLAYWRKQPPFEVVVQSATLHYRAVAIHPFANGNGRWARLLANIWLAQHRHAIVIWPETGFSTGTSPIRDEYLAACRAADAGDLAPLIALHRAHLEPE